MKSPRFRHIYMIGGTLIVLIYLFLSDPNGGNLTIPFIAKLATPIIAVWFAHLGRKAFFDYIDAYALYRKAKETATGAGLAFLGICIVIFGLLSLFGSQVYAAEVETYVPTQAVQYLPIVRSEHVLLWRDHPKSHICQP